MKIYMSLCMYARKAIMHTCTYIYTYESVAKSISCELPECELILLKSFFPFFPDFPLQNVTQNINPRINEKQHNDWDYVLHNHGVKKAPFAFNDQ